MNLGALLAIHLCFAQVGVSLALAQAGASWWGVVFPAGWIGYRLMQRFL